MPFFHCFQTFVPLDFDVFERPEVRGCPRNTTWGIQIYDGSNWTLISAWILTAVVPSELLAATLWLRTGDSQTSVAIWTCITTVQVPVLFLVYIS